MPFADHVNDGIAVASFRSDGEGATVKPRSGSAVINNSGATSPTVATARVESQCQTQPSPQQALLANSLIPRTLPPTAPLALRTRTPSQTRLPLPPQQTLFRNQLQVQPNQQQSQPQPPATTDPVWQSSVPIPPITGPTSSTSTPQQAPTSETARRPLQSPQRSNVTNILRETTTTATPQPPIQAPATASNQQSQPPLTSQTPGSSARVGGAAANAQVSLAQAQQPWDMPTIRTPQTQVQTQNPVVFTAAKRPYPFDNETGMHSSPGVLPCSATSPAEAKRVKTNPEDNLAQKSVSGSTAPASNTANYKTMTSSDTSGPAVVCYLMHTFALPLTLSPVCSAVVGCIRTLTMASVTSKQCESSAELYPKADGSCSCPKARG